MYGELVVGLILGLSLGSILTMLAIIWGEIKNQSGEIVKEKTEEVCINSDKQFSK